MSSASAAAESSESEEAEIVEEELGEDSDGEGEGDARDCPPGDDVSAPLQVAPPQPGWAAVVWRLSGQAVVGVALRVRCLLLGLVQLVRPAAILNTAYQRLEAVAAALRPPDGRRGKLVAWLRAAAGREVPGVAAAWRDGRLLCAAVQAAVPGSCPAPHDAHLHAGLRHGQALAHKFLRVPPAFSEEECLGQPVLTRQLERRLVAYLLAVHRASSRMALSEGGAAPPAGAAAEGGGGGGGPSVVARGMGLVLAVQRRRAVFYLYLLRPQTGASDSEESAGDAGSGSGSFHVHIVGPGGDFGSAVIPTTGMPPTLTVTEDTGGSDVSALRHPVAVTAARTRRGGGRRGPAPSASLPGWPPRRPRGAAPAAPAAPGQDIPLDFRPVPATAASPAAAVCVSYTPRSPGPHHLSVIWRGRHVPGSPFRVSVDESDGRSTPPAEAPRRLADDADVDAGRPQGQRQRRVLLRVVDFVTDKKVLLDDGRFAEMTPAQQRLLWRSNTEDPNRSSAMLRRLLTEAAEERSLMDEVRSSGDAEQEVLGSSPSQDSGDTGSEADARPAVSRPRKLRRSLNIQQSGSEEHGHQVEDEAGVQRHRYRRILGLCSLLLRQQTPRRQSLEVLTAAEHLLNGRPVRISHDTDRLVRTAICTLTAGAPADADRRPSSAPSSVRYGIDGSPGEASGLNAISELEDPQPGQGLAGKGRTYFARSRCKDRAALPREEEHALQPAEGAAGGPGEVGRRTQEAAEGSPDTKHTCVLKSFGSTCVNLTHSSGVQKELPDLSQTCMKLTDQISQHCAGDRSVNRPLHTETTNPVPTWNKEVTTAEKPASIRRGRVDQNLSPTDTTEPYHQVVPPVKTPDLAKPSEGKGEEAEVVPGIVRERIAAFEKQPPLPPEEEEVPTVKKIRICVHYIKPDEHTAKNGVEAYNNLSCCRADSPCTFLIAEDSTEDEAGEASAQTDHCAGTMLGEANGENVGESTTDGDAAQNSTTLAVSPGTANIAHNSSLTSGETDEKDHSTYQPHRPAASPTQGINTNDREELSAINLAQENPVREICRPEFQPSGSLSQTDEEKLIDQVFRISEDSVESLDDLVSHSQLEIQVKNDTAGLFGDVPNDERFDTVDPRPNDRQSDSLGEQGSETTLETKGKTNEWGKSAASGSSSVSQDITSQLHTRADGDSDVVSHVHRSVSLRVQKFETATASQNPTTDSGKVLPSISSSSNGSRDIAPQFSVRMEDDEQSSSVRDSEQKTLDGEPLVEVLTEDDIDLIYQTSVLADTTVQTSADELFEELYESLHTEDEAESTELVNGNAPINAACQAVTSSSDCDKSQVSMEPSTVNDFPNGDNMSGLDNVREENLTSTQTKGDVEGKSTVQVSSSNEKPENGGESLEEHTVSAVEDQTGKHQKEVTEPAAVSKLTEESLLEPTFLLIAENENESNVSDLATACTDPSNSSPQEFSAKELAAPETFRETPTPTDEKLDIRQSEENSEEQNKVECRLKVVRDKKSATSGEADRGNFLNEGEMIKAEQYESNTEPQNDVDYDLRTMGDKVPVDESESCEVGTTVGGELKFDETVSAQQGDVQRTNADDEIQASEPLGTDHRVDVAHSASWSERLECEPSTEETKEETTPHGELVCPDSQTNVSSPKFVHSVAENKSSVSEDEDLCCTENLGVSDALASSGEIEETGIGSKEKESHSVDEGPSCFSPENIQMPGGMVAGEVLANVSSADEAVQSGSFSPTTDTAGETGVEEPLVGKINEENAGLNEVVTLPSDTGKSTIGEVSRQCEQEAGGRSDDPRVKVVSVDGHSEDSSYPETVFMTSCGDETTMYDLSPGPTVQVTTNNVSAEEVDGPSGNTARLESPSDQIAHTEIQPVESVTEGLQREATWDDTCQVPASDVSRDEHGMENLSEGTVQTETTSSENIQPGVPQVVSSSFDDNVAVLPSTLETEIGVLNTDPPENKEVFGVLIDFSIDTSDKRDDSVSRNLNYGRRDWFENSAPCMASEETTGSAGGSAVGDILDFTAAPSSLMHPEKNFFDSQFDFFLAEKLVGDSEISQDFLISRRDDDLNTSSVSVIPAVTDYLNTEVDGEHREVEENKEIPTEFDISCNNHPQSAVEPEQPLVTMEQNIVEGTTIAVDQLHNNIMTPNVVPLPVQESITEVDSTHVLSVVETEGKQDSQRSEIDVSLDTKHFSNDTKFISHEMNETGESEKQAKQEGLDQKEMAEKEEVDEVITVSFIPGTGIDNANGNEPKGNFFEEESEVVVNIENDEETERKDIEELENGEKSLETKCENPEKDLLEKEEVITVNDMKEGTEDMVREEIQGLENGKKVSEEETEMSLEEKLQGEIELKGKELVTVEETEVIIEKIEGAETEKDEPEVETETRQEGELQGEVEMKKKMKSTDNENKLVVDQVEETEIEKRKSKGDNEIREEGQEEWVRGDELLMKENKVSEHEKTSKKNETTGKKTDGEGANSGSNPESITSQSMTESLLVEDESEFHLWPSDVPLGPPSGQSGLCSPVNAFDDSLVDFDSVIAAPSLEEALRQFEDGLERARLQNERVAQENCDSASSQYENAGSAGGRDNGASSEDANEYHSTPEGQYNSAEEQRAGDTADSGYLSTDDLHSALHRSPDASTISGVPRNKASPGRELPARCKPFQKVASDDKGRAGESGFMGPAEREIWGYQDDSDDESEWREGESTPVRYYPRVLTPGPPPMGPIAEEGEDGGHDGNKAVAPAAEVKPEGSPEQEVTSQSSTRPSKPPFSSTNKSPDSFDDSDNKSSDNASLADNERSATPSDDSRDMSPQGARDANGGDHSAPSPSEKCGAGAVRPTVGSNRGQFERDLSVPIIVIEDADLIDNLYTAFPPQIDRQVFSDSEVSDETKVKTRPRRRRLVYYDDTDLDVKKNGAASDTSGKPEPRTKLSGRKDGMRETEEKSATSSSDSPSNRPVTLDTDGDVSSSILSECAGGTTRPDDRPTAVADCSRDASVLPSSETVGGQVAIPENVHSGETDEVSSLASADNVPESLILEKDAAVDNDPEICPTDGSHHPNTYGSESQTGVRVLKGEETANVDVAHTVFEPSPGEAPVKNEDATPLLSANNVTICIIGATPTPDILELEGGAEFRAAQDTAKTVPDPEDVDSSEENVKEVDKNVENISEPEPEVKVECTDAAKVVQPTEAPSAGAATEPSCLAAVPVPSRVPAPVAQKRVSHWKQLWDVRCSFQKKRDRDGGVRRKRKSPSIRIPGIVSRWRKSFEASAGSGSSAANAGEGAAAGASGTTRASRIRQWRQYWDGLASAEAAQAPRDPGAPHKLSKLHPSAIALFDRCPQAELAAPDEAAVLPAVSSWGFQSPTPPPSYQELVLSGVIKPPPPPAPRKKRHRTHVQRGAPPMPPHPTTPSAQTGLGDSPTDEPPTASVPTWEVAHLDTPTLTGFPHVSSGARDGSLVEEQKMTVIAEGQQECAASAAVTPEEVDNIGVREGASVTVVHSAGSIPIPPYDEHERAVGEPRPGSVTPEPHVEENKKRKPHVSSRYISALATKEESVSGERQKASKALSATKKARAQLEKVVEVPARNIGPVNNVIIMPRTTADCPSYTAVYSTERMTYKSGRTERVEASTVSLGSKVDTSRDPSRKVEAGVEMPARTLQERTGVGSSGRPATGGTPVTSRPSGGDRRQKEKDKVSLAEFLALEVQDFDREDLASVQKLSGLFDDRSAAAPKAVTPPRTPTKKPAARPAPVIAIVEDSKNSNVQPVPEVRVPVVRLLVEEDSQPQQPPSPAPSMRGSFSSSREPSSRPTTPTVPALRPWSPTPQPPTAVGGDRGAEEAESRNRFERARLFFQSLEKSHSNGSRAGSLDSAPTPTDDEDRRGTSGHDRRRRRSGDGGVATPAEGAAQWGTEAPCGGGPRWQSRLAAGPGGSERLPRKVSERFHVRDLFRDVLGEGGVRGIPHQQAVLAALRSVESDGSRPVSPYEELAPSGVSSPDPDPDPEPYSDPEPDADPGVEVSARGRRGSPEPQAYLPEYPYLPRTPTRRFRPRRALLQPTLIPRRQLLESE